jgi:hypothetical protein
MFSFAILIASLFVNFIAGTYATRSVSNSVTDIVLSNIRVFNVAGIFLYGPIIFWILLILLLLSKPKTIPFTLKSISLFVIIRSVFISLTHIGPFPTKVIISSDLLSHFTFGGDLFFSGHTGTPFLLALIFWRDIKLRIAFLTTSVLFGIIVLMGHIHYSIDVLSAFFITHTIFYLCERFFKKDHQLFLQEEI